jgi:hypothetical protein
MVSPSILCEHRSVGSHLLQQQFPIDAYSCLSIFLAVFAQSTRQLAHTLQAVTTIQKILYVLRHNLGDITELVVQLVEVLRCATVLVQFLCALNKGIEFNKGIWTKGRREVL